MLRRSRRREQTVTVAADPTDSLLAFLAASPSPSHGVAPAAARLDAAGFKPLDEADAWDDVTGGHYIIRGGALVAWRVPVGAPAHIPFRVVGAHTDSPNLRLKPHPDTGSVGWRQLAVEVYGGGLGNSRLTPDPGLSGRIVLGYGSVRLLLVERPLARVPQLAIHLDREVNERGVILDKQAHLTPVWGLGPVTDGDLATFVAGGPGHARGDAPPLAPLPP